ncbi:MAG: hypothetical protein SGARI_002702, partial [Bacillariaceae sp.]
MCMEMRGVESCGSKTTTTKFLGELKTNRAIRQEFLGLVGFAAPIFCGPCACVEVDTVAEVPKMSKTSHVVKCQPNEAEDFKLYVKAAPMEYDEMARAFRDATFGFNKEEGTSLLDIGAGNGRFLMEILRSGVSISKYKAYEPDPILVAELEELIQQSDILDEDKTSIENSTFDGANEKFDVVLISHSLYGIKDKYQFISEALKCVADGGILLLFHRSGKTIPDLSTKLYKDNVLHHVETRCFDIVMDKLNDEELDRLSRYTNKDLACRARQKIQFSFDFLAIEPGLGRLSLEESRKRVSFAARSATPKAVVQPKTVVGIQACVDAALRNHGGASKLTVLGGGHSNNCFSDDAIVVDMANWRSITVDPHDNLVVVGGGATVGAITEAAEKYGLIVPLGDRPSIGAGLILQGGINHFMRRYGLACDNLVRVVYVSPKGQLCTASSDQELWPFRGAGSNFGVVVELTLKAYPVEHVFAVSREYSMHNSDCGPIKALH